MWDNERTVQLVVDNEKNEEIRRRSRSEHSTPDVVLVLEKGREKKRRDRNKC